MRLGRSMRLSLSCWPVMLKGLFTQLIIIALVIAVAVLIFGNVVAEIKSIADSLELGEFINSTVKSIADGNFDGVAFAEKLEGKINEVKKAIESLPNLWNRVEVSYAILILIVFIYRILVSSADVAVAFELNEFMTSNARRPFSWYFFKKSGESLKFVTMQFALTFPLDLLVVFGSIGFYLLFLITFRWWTIIPALIIALTLYAARHAILGFWLPSLTSEGLSVSKALTNGFSKIAYDFFRVFWKTLLILTAVEVLSVTATYFIANKAVGLAISAVANLIGFFSIKCINMVEYYETTDKPYFYKRVEIEGTEYYRKRRLKSKKD